MAERRLMAHIGSLPVTGRNLPDPGAPPVPEKTLSRWAQFLGSIATGVALADAMMKHFISRADIEACVRSDPAEYERWTAARMAAYRKTFTTLMLEDIFAQIAGGSTTKDALAAVGIQDGQRKTEFNKLCALDPEVNRQFLDACKARTLHLAEEVIEIADDDSNDVLSGEKGDIPNNAAVNRSKLRVESRMRLMGAYNKKLYGEKNGPEVSVAVQVNHASVLEAARGRRDTRGVKISPRQIQQAIDADLIVPEPQQPDTSWLDDPGKPDTSWLD